MRASSFCFPWACLLVLSCALRAPSVHAEIAPLRDRVQLGAYVAGLPYFEKSAREFVALEKKLGSKLPILSGFVDWDYEFGGERDLLLTAGGTRTLLYSWEPHCKPDAPTDCISFARVIRGDYDAYLLRIAANMRKFPHDIYVRPWGEMNAEWSAWQPDSNKPRGGSTAEFIAAWRHVRTLFKREQVNNLKFIFNPDASNDETTIPIAKLWPGAEYVDVLGIDGYNWGLGLPNKPGSWSEFDDIFLPMYEALTALHPSAPVWICEVGSKEPQKNDGNVRPAPRDPTHKKSSWVEAMMTSKQFPRVTALVVFNVYKERDFRFESSEDSLRAIRKQLSLRAQ